MFAGIFEHPNDRNPVRDWLLPMLQYEHVAATVVRAVNAQRSGTYYIPRLVFWMAWVTPGCLSGERFE
ncbi:MAG: hypothetical protein EOP20_10510 [Hyphomicrobiales bacterium]|nr:MAG: hypothetical protein EOP20_10510 [Hyphomicrobiales bacterium]